VTVQGRLLDHMFTMPYGQMIQFEYYWMRASSRLLAIIPLLAWLPAVVLGRHMPIRLSRLTLASSFASAGVAFYLIFIAPVVYPWYIPGVAVMAIFTYGLISQDIFQPSGQPEDAKRSALWERLAKAGIVAAIAFMALVTVTTAHVLEVQQRVVERGLREPLGLYLKESARSPRDTVMLECLGYIGFYSGLKMYDYPGLSSPEMVAARKKLGSNDYATLVRELKPDWLSLRDREVNWINQSDPDLLDEQYQVARRFDVSEEVAQQVFIPNRRWLQMDQSFTVYRRKAPETTSQPESFSPNGPERP